MADISRHTIVILVVLTVIISFLGTWTVIHEVNKINLDDGETRITDAPRASGQAAIKIVEPETGKVSIEVVS